MHGENLNTAVQNGLAWYYVLVTLLNLGAGAHWIFWSRERRMPEWANLGMLIFGAVYLLMVVLWITGFPPYGLLLLGLIGNIMGLVILVPTAVSSDSGAGKLWVACALGFQILGLPYVFGAGFAMPEAVKGLIDSASNPVSFFVLSSIAFALFCIYREFLTRPAVIWSILNLSLLYFGFSLTDYDFRVIVAKPDNVPITMMIFFVGGFTWLAMRRAVINDERAERGLKPVEAEQSEKVLVWPDLVYTEMIAMIICTVVLVLWSIVLRAPLEEWANLAKTPNPSKAPWYFLGLQEMLVYYDPWLAGVVFPGLIIVGLMAIPYIDFNKAGNGYYTFNQRKFSITVFLFGFVPLWVLMVMLGTFLRGPGWNFFGPYQYWDPHLVLPLNNIDLSDYFWVHMLGRGKPKSWLIREMPGFIVVLGYLALLPPLMAKTVFKGFFVRMGFARYMVFAGLFLSMAALPAKMLLRWIFNLKYIVHIDEFFFNI